MWWFRVVLLAVLLVVAGAGLAVERQVRQLNQTMLVFATQQRLFGTQQTAWLTRFATQQPMP